MRMIARMIAKEEGDQNHSVYILLANVPLSFTFTCNAHFTDCFTTKLICIQSIYVSYIICINTYWYRSHIPPFPPRLRYGVAAESCAYSCWQTLKMPKTKVQEKRLLCGVRWSGLWWRVLRNVVILYNICIDKVAIELHRNNTDQVFRQENFVFSERCRRRLYFRQFAKIHRDFGHGF